jgi:hypothetical protein
MVRAKHLYSSSVYNPGVPDFSRRHRFKMKLSDMNFVDNCSKFSLGDVVSCIDSSRSYMVMDRSVEDSLILHLTAVKLDITTGYYADRDMRPGRNWFLRSTLWSEGNKNA